MKMKWIFTAIVLMATATAYAGVPTVEEQVCFDAVNAMRAKTGLPPFVFSAELSEGCRSWSATLREKGRLYHAQPYENCACGNTAGTATFRQWYNSSGHRALLLHRSAAEAGIGCDGTYWTFRVKAKAREVVIQPVETSIVTKTRVSRRHCCR